MAFNKTYLDEVIARSIYGTPLRSSKLLSRKLSEGEVISNIPSNGDIITITGTGFGASAPTVLIWDTVDNQGDVYDLLADGTTVPLRSLGTVDAPYFDGALANRMTLESVNTYGNRGRVYSSVGASHLGRPISSEQANQGNSSIYSRFYVKATVDLFGSELSSDKFFRRWDDTDGVYYRTSITNHAALAVATGGVSIQQDIRGLSNGANEWFLVESWIDGVNNLLTSRFNNVDTHRISDPVITPLNPAANGFIDSLWGFDDGDSTTEGVLFQFADYYSSNDRRRVDLCNNPDWKRATIREVQQVTSWADGEVKFTLDAQRLDPENCWAVALDDNEEVLAVHKVGTPTAIYQAIRRPAVSATAGAVRLVSEYFAFSADFAYKCKFIIMPSSCTEFRFFHSGFSSRITYNLATQEWLLRSGGGTEKILSASRAWDDGLEHSLDVLFSATTATIRIDENPVLEIDTTGTFNNYQATYIGNVTSLVAPVAGYIWEVQLIDVNRPTTSRYYKFDEQVGDDANFIKDYSQDPAGIVTGTVANVYSWLYLPSEG